MTADSPALARCGVVARNPAQQAGMAWPHISTDTETERAPGSDGNMNADTCVALRGLRRTGSARHEMSRVSPLRGLPTRV